MKEHLKQIAKSYDEAIDLGRKGIDRYKNLPESITNHPYYNLFLKMQEEDAFSSDSRKIVYDYLKPKKGMKFIDLGCSLNLMFRGYSDWESIYYGVDISKKTIELLNEHIKRNHKVVGDLYCGSMHESPYEDNFFDIGSCIGSIEYYEKEFVIEIIEEMYRIMKPKSKFVLDIPDVGSREFEIGALIEKYLGREDKFNISIIEFEQIIEKYFEIEKKEKAGSMLLYFLICKK